MMKKVKKIMAQKVRWPGERLSDEEIENIFKSDESLAEYLSSLAPHQVEDFKDAVIASSLSTNEKNTLLKLMDHVYLLARETEREYEQKILPLATNICTVMALMEQIEELENIQSSLSS